MFGENLIIRAKPSQRKPQKPSNSRFQFIRTFTDKFYKDPFKWGLIKSIAFFAAGIFVARTLSDLDILPADGSQEAAQAAY